jgi:two-component system NtrC family sensor kinase
MEEELTHAKKMGTLGEVLTRFTHEFNNLLAGILGHTQLLKSEMEQKGRGYHKILSIEDLATKALSLGKNILSFSRKEKFETEDIDIDSLLRSVLNLIEKTVLRDVQVSMDAGEGPFFIVANKERLSLVLFNLLINAKDAIKETKRKGEISIQVDSEEDPKSGKPVVRIRIGDNGSGIDDDNIKKIFLPYFTTKGKGGTGLGLSTVKQIVEKSGGSISVESRLDVGTVFTIRLPQEEPLPDMS